MVASHYPSEAILQEIGRVTIVSSRLDAALGEVWRQVEPDADARYGTDKCPLPTRERPNDEKNRKRLCAAARANLRPDFAEWVVRVVDEQAKTVRTARNALVHQDWVLRGGDGARSVADIMSVPEAQRAAYIDAWAREAIDSTGWLRHPADSHDLDDKVPSIDDLVQIEQDMRRWVEELQGMTFRLASIRVSLGPEWIGYRPPAFPNAQFSVIATISEHETVTEYYLVGEHHWLTLATFALETCRGWRHHSRNVARIHPA